MKKIIILLLTVSTLISCETKAQGKKGISNTSVIEKISVSKFNKSIVKKDIQLVDVRTPQEYAQGHVSNAKNINLFDANFKNNLKQLDKNKAVFLYCRSGKRSAKASKILKELGFKKVYDLKGGYLAWSR